MDLFNSKHSWLIISRFLNVISYFNKTNLNIAADLTVAINDGQKWTLFDIYNPCSRNGGKLRTEILGDYGKNDSFLFRRNYSKYSRGRNMKEVHFKSKIVVSTDSKFIAVLIRWKENVCTYITKKLTPLLLQVTFN